MINRRGVFAWFAGLAAYAVMLPRVLRAAPIIDPAVDTVVQIKLKDGAVQLEFTQDGYTSILHGGDIRSLADVLLKTVDRYEGRKSFVLSLPADTMYVGLKGSFEITEQGTLRYGTEFIPDHIGRVEREFEKSEDDYRRQYDAATGTHRLVRRA